MSLLSEYDIVGVESLQIDGYDNAIQATIRFHHLHGEIKMKMLDIKNTALWDDFDCLENDCNSWFKKLKNIDALLNMGVSGWVIPVNVEPMTRVLGDKYVYENGLYIAILFKAVFIYDDIAETGDIEYILDIKNQLFVMIDYLRDNKDKTLQNFFEINKEAEKAYNKVVAIQIIADVFEKHAPFRYNAQMHRYFQAYFQSTILESAVTNGVRLSSLSTLYLREWVTGMSWSHGMNSANANIDSDFYWQKYIGFQLCWRLTTQYVTFANDILSCAKEYRDGIKLNVVISEMKDSGINMMSAISHCNTILNKIFDDYFACKKMLLQTVDWEDKVDIENLCILLEGAMACPIWHFRSPRYNLGVRVPNGQVFKDFSKMMIEMKIKASKLQEKENLFTI
ncbi:hypothetical protein [Methylomicrobium sp. Wu6]|uniref:terpene synthase family protein n=1 Tax=Methylomicrobium sp. Wu6 TaxID=3107928 RepID=UPI002DD687CE|nr:hypothetical protein [Methylomicrobium sp. Wu6]MEC4748795.1 hypothetical protein [Methylomicrobium sp. Wu6]